MARSDEPNGSAAGPLTRFPLSKVSAAETCEEAPPRNAARPPCGATVRREHDAPRVHLRSSAWLLLRLRSPRKRVLEIERTGGAPCTRTLPPSTRPPSPPAC